MRLCLCSGRVPRRNRWLMSGDLDKAKSAVEIVVSNLIGCLRRSKGNLLFLK